MWLAVFQSAKGFCCKYIYLAEGQTAQKPLLLNNAKPWGIFPIVDKLETEIQLEGVLECNFQMWSRWLIAKTDILTYYSSLAVV